MVWSSRRLATSESNAYCPFHTLALEYSELVCGVNLRLLNGFLGGLAPTGLTAHQDSAPPHCCVRHQHTAAGEPRSDLD
jgi:predicted ArsR family transcriptional regulator